jgi:molecular chaperone DnaJ
MTDSNHYQTLNLSQDATQEQVKQAYRELVKQFHPDSQSETANHDMIVNINAAYEILGDPQRRRVYDQQLMIRIGSFSSQRQQRTAYAQEDYKRRRQAEKDGELYLHQWYQKIYLPLHRLINKILNPLKAQIEYLADDPFDDRLMSVFAGYLQQCRHYLNQAKRLFSSQPNPPKLAKTATNIYHCLNQISDGIEELELFTLNYDDRHLHTGTELFRIAYRLFLDAQKTVIS